MSLSELLDERRAITQNQLGVLLQMQRYATTYTQRIVEHLSFLPGGGQQWQRDLQLLVPEGLPRTSGGFQTIESDEGCFILSLGMFRRRRLADFEVRDSRGRRLNLLTRFQHGHCMASSLIMKYLDPDHIDQLDSEETPPQAWQHLYKAAFDMSTTVVPRRNPQLASEAADAAAGDAGLALSQLLRDLGIDEDVAADRAALFYRQFLVLHEVTQYLCWVEAQPGETINLTATYTMADAPEAGRWAQVEGSGPDLSGTARRRKNRMAFYVRCGLGPVSYELRTPVHDHAGSYYFVLEPPEDTRVSFLDWGVDNSIDAATDEVDCAHPSVHIHNGERLAMLGPADEPDKSEPQPPPTTTGPPDTQPRCEPEKTESSAQEHGPARPEHPTRAGTARPNEVAEEHRVSIPSSSVYAFLRAAPREHWPLLLGAALNMLLAFLAQNGEFVPDSGAVSAVLLIAPTALLAYIAQQRRHYYAEVTGWLPLLMLIYLAANIVFVVSVRYDVLGDDELLGRTDILDDLVSGAMLVGSALLILWFLAIRRNPGVVERQFRRNGRHESRSWTIFALRRGFAKARRGRGPRKWVGNLLFTPAVKVRRSLRLLLGETVHGGAKDVYSFLVFKFGDRVMLGVSVLVAAAIALMVALGWGEGREDALTRKRENAVERANDREQQRQALMKLADEKRRELKPNQGRGPKKKPGSVQDSGKPTQP